MDNNRYNVAAEKLQRLQIFLCYARPFDCKPTQHYMKFAKQYPQSTPPPPTHTHTLTHTHKHINTQTRINLTPFKLSHKN